MYQKWRPSGRICVYEGSIVFWCSQNGLSGVPQIRFLLDSWYTSHIICFLSKYCYYISWCCTIVLWKSAHPLLFFQFPVWVHSLLKSASTLELSFVCLMECMCGVCISEVRNFMLYIAEGCYKAALHTQTYPVWCTLQSTPWSWWYGAVQNVVVPSGLDWWLHCALLLVHLFASRTLSDCNVTWVLFCG